MQHFEGVVDSVQFKSYPFVNHGYIDKPLKQSIIKISSESYDESAHSLFKKLYYPLLHKRLHSEKNLLDGRSLKCNIYLHILPF